MEENRKLSQRKQVVKKKQTIRKDGVICLQASY
jgi:hypothetical protein